jgi:hypothetical protein
MAFEILTPQVSLPAGADLSAAQFRAVVLNSSGKVVLAGAATVALGILQNDPKADEAADVFLGRGITFAQVGASVTPGQALTTNASGQLVPAGAGQPIIAYALESGSSGNVISVVFGFFGVV